MTGRGRRRRSAGAARRRDIAPPMSNRDALLKLLASPDLCSKRWVYEQYDFADSRQYDRGPRRRRRGDPPRRRAQGPRADHRRDAALLRSRPCRGRQAGGRRSLAQPDRRRRAAAGADRQSQFRQSRKTVRRWASSSAVSRGSARRRARSIFPIVSGNVSLYNETHGLRDSADAGDRRRRPASTTWPKRRRSPSRRRARTFADRRGGGLARAVGVA